MREKICKASQPLRLIVTLLLIACADISSVAQQIDSALQFDPSVAINLDINEKVRAEFFIGHEDSEDITRNRWKVRAGLSYRLKPLFRGRLNDDPEGDKRYFLVVKTNYEYSRTTLSNNTDIEHRLTVEVTPRHQWPGRLLTSDRSRLEFRWINGLHHLRYRNRIRGERPFKMGKLTATPYISAEAYWDQRFHKWNQVKFTGGADIPLSRNISLDTYYERRNCITCPARHINILGVSLNLYFKLKH